VANPGGFASTQGAAAPDELGPADQKAGREVPEVVADAGGAGGAGNDESSDGSDAGSDESSDGSDAGSDDRPTLERMARALAGDESDDHTVTVAVPRGKKSDLVVAIGRTCGQYELIRPLGRGGMGQVFLARDTRLGRLVALKFMRRRSTEHTRRFLEEARATARCNHPSIVTIYEADEHLGHPYMVLEYLAGKTLRQWMEQRHGSASRERAAGAGLSPAYAAELMIPVVRALVYAHELGIVHRDLKPENIMLAESGVIKVLDFGIAKMLAGAEAAAPGKRADTDVEALNRTGNAAGTAYYMAPEQWVRAAPDHRVDIWAVGIVLYELVTGVHPLAPMDKSGLAAALASDAPMPRLRELHPEIGKLGAIIDRCLIKRKDDRLGSARELLSALESIASPRRGSAFDEDASPYPGLAPFQERDAERFFGRAQAVAMVVNRLAEQPLLVVVGPSGAGKSSFVRAGVVPALDRTGDAWESFVVRPGPQPLAALAGLLSQHAWEVSTAVAPTAPNAQAAGDSMTGLAAVSTEELCARLHAEPGFLGAQLRARARRRLSRIVLFVDQFEELYTMAPAGERAAFFACLAGVADDVAAPLRLILSLRSDFLDRTADLQAALPGFQRGLMLLPPMNREGLREALVRPLEGVGHGFEEDELVTDMLGALEHTGSALPLLQFTAARLWELRDRQRRLLTRQSYRQLGGVAGILASHADAVLGAMTLRDRALARALFLRLVTPERTRAVVSVDELRELARPEMSGMAGTAGAAGAPGAPGEAGEAGAIDRVLAHLVDARLLVVETGGAGPHAPTRSLGRSLGHASVEIVHESLIESWPALAAWISESHDDLAFLGRVRHAAREWHAGGRLDELLWRGQAADRARVWQQRYTGELAQTERDFLQAVLAAATRAQRHRRLVLTGAIAALTLVAAVMGLLAWRERAASRLAAQETARAQQAAGRALTQARLARDAGRMAVARELEADPTTVLSLLREVEARDIARSWPVLASSAIRAGVARAVLIGHEDQVFAARFSPDARHVATASWDGTVRLWPADGIGAPVVLRGHTDRVFHVSFSPDGTRLVSASADGTARIWRVDAAGEVSQAGQAGEAGEVREAVVLAGHGDGIRSAVFSPDGTRVLTASLDGTARIWDVRTEKPGAPVVLSGHTDQLRVAWFSPDGARVLTASVDGTARIWNADGTGTPIILAGHTDRLFTATFSADGTRVVTVSGDKTARVWNADGTGEPVVLEGHEAWILDAVFDPGGRRVATSGLDNTARVWNADGTGEPIVLKGHGDTVFAVRFTPDGTRLVTTSSDKTARIWNLDQGTSIVLRGHTGLVRAAELSPDGARLVTAAEDNTARVWNVDGTPQPHVLTGHQAAVYSVAFSPDGKRLLSGSVDRTARLWTLDGTAEPIVFAGHAGPVSSAIFDPTGTRVATGSFDKTVRLWNLDGTPTPVVLTGHTGWIGEVDFSPDGARIATAASDHTIRVWNADGSGEPLVLTGHAGEVLSAKFDAGGTRLVSASADKTVRLWRMDRDPGPVLTLAHPAVVYVAHFSPDGTRIVSACGDGIARVWNADGSGQPLLLEGPTDSLTWANFSPDGTRVITAARDYTAWIWNADGSGVPIVLRGHTQWIDQAAFSPDGTMVATSSEDSTIRLWSDIEPIELDEDWLWRATSYCLPVATRRALLNMDEETAIAQHADCLRRVERARLD
jgi:WD40 repeat protein/serine/threonine protein kinase